MTSDQQKDPSDHDDHSEGRDLASVEDPAGLEDPTGFPDETKLDNLMMSEEEERDRETFTLASTNTLNIMTSSRAPLENTKVYSLSQQVHRQDDLFTSQASSVDSHALPRIR